MFLNRSSIVGSVTALLAFVACDTNPSPEEAADLVLLGGHIVTMNESQPEAEAIAITGDRILAVGTNEEIESFVDTGTETLELVGMTVVPGMIDSHAHLVPLGKRLTQLDARGKSKDEIIALVEERVATTAPGEWVFGTGWDQTTWTVKEYPAKEDLDPVSSQNPVFLQRIDDHSAWVNSAALKAAGVTKETSDPHGGYFVRDESGEPTGMLIDNAFRMVTSQAPPLSKEQLMNAIEAAIHHCLAFGVTGIHDLGGFREEIEAFEEMMKADRFDFRVYEFVRWPVNEQVLPHTYESLDHYLERGPQIGLCDNRLTIRGIKMTVDGALGSRGAALLEPYSDDPDNNGLTRLTDEEVYETLVRGLRAGFHAGLHCIGDRGNRIALDAMEKALNEVPTEDHRLRIEHAQILHPDDVPRFAELGIIPTMQATHATSDMRWAEDRIGAERLQYAYAWRTMIDTGVRIPGGSDAPVESINPLVGIYAGVTRQDANGWPQGGWFPEQRLTREEALRTYTLDAAYAAFEEDLKGSLEPGKLADLVVLSKDIMTIPAPEILDTEVLMTFLGGKVVYRK
jgi:predicted amidohydrolase YtcJ